MDPTHPFRIVMLLLLLLWSLPALPGPNESKVDAVTRELESALRDDPPPSRAPTLATLDQLPLEKSLATGDWVMRRYLLTEDVTPLAKAPDQPQWLVVPVDLADDRDYYAVPSEPLWGWDRLSFELQIPADFPDAGDLYIFVKDWDDLWLHIRHPLPPGAAGQTLPFTIPLSGESAMRAWTPRGHHRRWHQSMPDQIAEVGIKLAMGGGASSEYTGSALLSPLQLSRDGGGWPGRVYDVQRRPELPKVGDMLELSFRLTHLYRAPFDRQDVDLMATVGLPGGESLRTRVFYQEDFHFDNQRRRSHLLVPSGAPRFSARFTPPRPGEYTIAIAGMIGGAALELPVFTIEVLPTAVPWKGFVRVSPHDDRLLVHSADNSEFWGLGMNMRSPYDTRYAQSFPFTKWDETDFEIYEKLLPKYAAAGINVIEVWMSPWWLALEWIPDAPGNHGLGHMNQWRSWKIDRMMQLAEKHGIYVILVINNHGKFSAWIDSDWARSPFNVKNGGPLETPMEYFSKPVAKEAYKVMADYMVARWGYSTNLLAWKLFTEIDLTGDNREWYKNPVVTEWHQFAARYLQSIDPNRHMVTTHWATSFQMVNRELANLPELDIVTLDIYYGGTGAKLLFDFMFSTSDFVDTLKKPGIITEFGGSPHGDTLPHILHQLHMGLWAGFFTKFPVSPCFWWYPLVEEKNLYGMYTSVANFTAGEKRTGAKAYNRSLTGGLHLCELRQPDSRMFWLLDTRHYFGGSLTIPPKIHRNVDVRLPDMKPGTYTVEFWDCQTGMRMEDVTWVVEDTPHTPTLQVPVFQRDIAAKIRPARQAR